MSEIDSVWARRAQRLADKVQRPVLLPAGQALPRNYKANCFPFRAQSHFLHLVGEGIEGAYVAVEADGRATLFLPVPSLDDALWSGPGIPLEAWHQKTGLKVEPLDNLPHWAGLKEAVTIPGLTLEMREQQRKILNRPMGSAGDEALIAAMVSERLCHDDYAQAGLKAAAEHSVNMHLAVAKALRSRAVKREQDAVCALESVLSKHGLCHSFSPIATVRGDILHNPYHHREVKPGDLLLVDAGAEDVTGYAGDITRTWPVSGRFSSTQAEAYDAVHAAWRAAMSAVVVGARYRDVHFAAIRALTEALVSMGIFLGDVDELVEDGCPGIFMPHGVGHLLGLDVHDMEDLGDKAGYAPGRRRSNKFGYSALRLDRDLKEGMAFTIEPGCYFNPEIIARAEELCPLKGRLNRKALALYSDVNGIRIEDDVLITVDGPQILTSRLLRDRQSIEAYVGNNDV